MFVLSGWGGVVVALRVYVFMLCFVLFVGVVVHVRCVFCISWRFGSLFHLFDVVCVCAMYAFVVVFRSFLGRGCFVWVLRFCVCVVGLGVLLLLCCLFVYAVVVLIELSYACCGF